MFLSGFMLIPKVEEISVALCTSSDGELSYHYTLVLRLLQ